MVLIFIAACANTGQPEGNDENSTAPDLLLEVTTEVSIPDAVFKIENPTLESKITLEVTDMVFMLTSLAFEHKQAIPPKFTCTGEDISPELTWNDPPEGTQSYGLIMDDPDAPAGTWVHWVMYNIPANLRGLTEAVPGKKDIEGMGMNGLNSWPKIGYRGPCPPLGTHRYFFRIYALDTKLGLDSGASKPELIKAMQGHILGIAELMGTFKK
jgi:hypothetical protein